MKNCSHCQMFTNKVFRHPIIPSVDLFGLLPSQNQIAVTEDFSSHYPVAKFVKSTSAKSVIPTLEEAYNTFGNPVQQKSDNGPPFNSETLADNRNIEHDKMPPGHPFPNNTENIMKPLGKTIKIGYSQNQGEKKTLLSFLVNFCDTPHFATSVAPANVIFQDGYSSNLLHKSLYEKDIYLDLETSIKN